jgi:hypothetical protein
MNGDLLKSPMQSAQNRKIQLSHLRRNVVEIAASHEAVNRKLEISGVYVSGNVEVCSSNHCD